MLPFDLLFPLALAGMRVAFLGSGLLLPTNGIVDEDVVDMVSSFDGSLKWLEGKGGVGARPVEGRRAASLANGAVVRVLRNIASRQA